MITPGRALCLAIIMFACAGPFYAQEGHLQIRVTDTNRKPISGIRLILTTPPKMPSRPTNNDGITQLLVTHYEAGKPIFLELFDAPPKMILFPPIQPVPPSRCRTILPIQPEPAEVTLVIRGQKKLLESSRAITTIVSSLLENTFQRSFAKGVAAEPRLSSLLELSSLLDLDPIEIDKAIRVRSQNSTEAYEKGLLALYEQNYAEATKNLSAFLKEGRAGTNGKVAYKITDVSLLLGQSKPREITGNPSALAGDRNAARVNAALFLGQAFYEQGKYSEAADIYQRLASLRPDDITVLRPLAVSLYGAGQYERAISIFDRVLFSAHRERDIRLEAVILGNLGDIYSSIGQYRKALDVFYRSISLSREIEDFQSEATLLRKAGSVYYELGEVSHALEYFNQSLAISRRLDDKESELKTLGEIGLAFGVLENERAIVYFSQALELSRQLGDKAAEGVSLLNIATMYSNTGKYAEAERYFRQSIEIQQSIFGTDHPNVAYSLEGLATSFAKQGKYDEAEALFKEVLTIEEKVFGPKHQSVVRSINNLAWIYSQVGRYPEAELLYKRSLAIRESLDGPGGIEEAFSLRALADIYYKQERYNESEVLIKRALYILETGLGRNDLDLIPTLEMYELILRKTNRDAQANDVAKRIAAMRAKSSQRNPRE